MTGWLHEMLTHLKTRLAELIETVDEDLDAIVIENELDVALPTLEELQIHTHNSKPQSGHSTSLHFIIPRPPRPPTGPRPPTPPRTPRLPDLSKLQNAITFFYTLLRRNINK